MTTMVAFGVLTKHIGDQVLDRLEGVAEDTALVYRTARGRVKIQQSSDLSTARDVFRGGVLRAAVGVFTAALGPVAPAESVGEAWGALRHEGVDAELMRLPGRQLEFGRAVVFVLASDDAASAIVAVLRSAGLVDIRVCGFTARAAQIVRAQLTNT